MSKFVRILGIAGSRRQASYNRAAQREATKLLPDNATLDIFELDGIPGFNQDEEQSPPSEVVELKRRVRESNAILIVPPEYNYSVPGVLKNAIDWASRPYGDSAWDGKPVAILGASIGATGTARAQYHLRQSFVFLNMYPLNHTEVDDRQCLPAVRRRGKFHRRNHEETHTPAIKKPRGLDAWIGENQRRS